MAKKKNRGAVVFLLFALLLVVILVYILVLPALNKDDSSEDETAEESIVIADFDDDDMTSLTYTYGGEELTFVYNSKTYEWSLENDSEFPVDQTILYAMAEAVSQISAERSIPSEEIDIADTGLDEPSYTISVAYGSKEYTYYIGDYNSFSAQFYFKAEGDDNIYMIPSGLQTNFQYKLLDVLDVEDVPSLSADNVTYYTVTTQDETVTIEDDTHLGYLSSLYTYSAVEYKPDEESIEYYLLDDVNAAVISIPYTVTTTVQNDDSSVSGASVSKDYLLTIKVGGLCDDDDSKRYVMLNDSPIVYKMSASILSSVMTPSEEAETETETETEEESDSEEEMDN